MFLEIFLFFGYLGLRFFRGLGKFWIFRVEGLGRVWKGFWIFRGSRLGFGFFFGVRVRVCRG